MARPQNRGDYLYTVVRRGLIGFAVLCWLLTGVAVAFMAAGEPEAINMAIGVGVWGVVSTVALVGWTMAK